MGHGTLSPYLPIHTLWILCLPTRPKALQVGLHYIGNRAPSEGGPYNYTVGLW